MKKILILLLCFSATVVSAQNKKFNTAMKKNLAAMDTSFKTPEGILSLANNFERIGNAEKDQWLPYYYAAFLQVNYGFQINDPSKMDGIADKAEFLINIADSLSPQNSEISAVKSMIASCRLMVDPMSRYIKYGSVSAKYLDESIKLDPLNPRPYLLKAQSLKFTPEQFGGGCGPALPFINNAVQKFKDFISPSSISPTWGEDMAKKLLEDCSK